MTDDLTDYDRERMSLDESGPGMPDIRGYWELTFGRKVNNGSCVHGGHDALAELGHDYPIALVRLPDPGRRGMSYTAELRWCVKHYEAFREAMAALPAWADSYDV